MIDFTVAEASRGAQMRAAWVVAIDHEGILGNPTWIEHYEYGIAIAGSHKSLNRFFLKWIDVGFMPVVGTITDNHYSWNLRQRFD